MNMQELHQIKMAWLAAEEAGDTSLKLALLRDYPDLQDQLIEFVAAYHVTSQAGAEPEILPMTQRAMQSALERTFAPQTQPLPVANLRELRTSRGLSLSAAARGLHLGLDVWKKFEDGLIELSSLGERQLARLAAFFQVNSEQFGAMLTHSQPSLVVHRRQTAAAAKHEQQHAQKQRFAEALAKSTMSPAEQRAWLEA